MSAGYLCQSDPRDRKGQSVTPLYGWAFQILWNEHNVLKWKYVFHVKKKVREIFFPSSLKVLQEGDATINRLQFDIETMTGEAKENLPSTFATPVLFILFISKLLSGIFDRTAQRAGKETNLQTLQEGSRWNMSLWTKCLLKCLYKQWEFKQVSCRIHIHHYLKYCTWTVCNLELEKVKQASLGLD